MAKQSRVERKRDEAKRRILDAAEYLFFQKQGYEKTTMRDIAEKADVSTGAVYTHFTSKPDLMAIIIDRYFSIHREGVSKILGSSKTGIAKIKDYIDYFFRLLTKKKFMVFLQYMSRLNPEDIENSVLESLKIKARQVLQYVEEMIRLGQEDGTIARIGSAELMAFTFMYVMQSFVRDLSGKSLATALMLFPGSSVDDILRQLKRMMVTALQNLNRPA